MVLETEVKAYPREDRGGWVIYLPKKLVEDSSFPVDKKKKISVKIDGKKLIIENR